MSEMGSFYGGRTGASFVIVKRFDGIDIPTTTYTEEFYAIQGNTWILSNSGNTPVTDGVNTKYLIAKTEENKNRYGWKKQINDGSLINDTAYAFPTTLAEGMNQCFAKGAETTSLVNYGEYVIIDTIANMKDYGNLDNGKVFKRGFSGAEYVGQVIGNKGGSAELDLDSYSKINSSEYPTHRSGEYTVASGDIVPGSYIDGTGTRAFNDSISYAWVDILDDNKDIKNVLIGFKFPTLVQDLVGEAGNPYIHTGLITEDPSEYIDGKWKHPFYQKWIVKCPQGYHGTNSTDIEILPTKTYDNAKYYTDYNCTIEEGAFTTSQDLDLNSVDYDKDGTSFPVGLNGRTVYVKREDCTIFIMRYTETSFDSSEQGTKNYFTIGVYNTINKIDLSEDGDLIIYYTGKESKEIISQRIRMIDNIEIEDDGTITFNFTTGEHDTFEKTLKWLDNVEINTENQGGIEGSGDQKVHLNYNTGETDIIGNPLNYIIDTAVSYPTAQYPDVPYSHLLVYYSDPVIRQQLGSNYVYHSSKLDTDVAGWVDLGSVEGAAGGVHIIKSVYSLDELKDENDNWIPPEQLEDSQSHIIREDSAGWNVALLIYSAVGTIEGALNAIQVVANDVTPTAAQITKAQLDIMVPDNSFNIGDYIILTEDSIEIWAYDYEKKEWFSIGALAISKIDPNLIISVSDSMPVTLNEDGIWLIKEEMFSV
jgi:hypothetical protein